MMSFPKVFISPNTQRLCNYYARKACIGGRSNIREGRSRMDNLHVDQFSGQLGNLAGSVFILGAEQGMSKYIEAREKANENPYKGDGGVDIPGLPVDVKCSKIRNQLKKLATYNMFIMPREVHNDWIYLQTLANREEGEEDIVVHIMGWAKTEDLPAEVETSGIFKGAFVIPVSKLRDPKTIGIGCCGLRI